MLIGKLLLVAFIALLLVQQPATSQWQWFTRTPSRLPTKVPTATPTVQPSRSPTPQPTQLPTIQPTLLPTKLPTLLPTHLPTHSPTSQPTRSPSRAPTTSHPTHAPSHSPSKAPTISRPTQTPTTSVPTLSPTTSQPTQAPTTSQPTQSPTRSPTFMCPAGMYSNSGNDTQTDMCVKCPAGMYDLPTSIMRTDCDGRSPCDLLDYWCGPGAVLDETYVQVVEHGNIKGTLVVASKSEFTVEFTKLVNGPMVITAHMSTLPRGVALVSDAIALVEDPIGSTFIATFSMEADLLQGLSGDGLNEFYSSIIMLGRFAYEPVGIATFSSEITIEIQLVSVVVNPELFSYSLMIGEVYFHALSPLPASEVLNPLCEDDLQYNATICPAGLLEFAENTTTSALITSDQGSGKKTEFVINLTDVEPQEDWSLPARVVHTCISFNMKLIPLGTSFVKTVDVAIKILQYCPPGTSSLSGNNEFGCTKCSETTYQPNHGSSLCFPVSPGTEVNADRTDVVSCKLGHISNSGFHSCFPCPLGSYADDEGSSICKPCPSATFPTTLQVGATSIDNCTTDELQNAFKNSDGQLQACPAGTTCDFDGVTVATIKVNAGFYRTSNTSLDVRPCKQNFCVPDYYANDSSTTRRLLYSAQEDSTYCTPHHRGHLCETCENGYVHRGDYRLCEMCLEDNTSEDTGRIAGIFVAFFVVISAGCTFTVYRAYESYKPKPFIPISADEYQAPVRKGRVGRIVTKVTSIVDLGGTPLKITIGYYQVVAGMAIALRDFLPDYFGTFADLFSLLSLDFIKVFDFGCSLPNQSHLVSLLLSTLVPVTFLALLRVLEWLIMRRVPYADIVHIGFMNLYLWILFLIYPSVAKTIFQTFDCIQFDDGMAVIEVDPQTMCAGDQYSFMIAYGVLSMIICVLGVPVWFYVLLDRQRFQLNAAPEFEPRISLAYREKNLEVQGTVMLWSGYSPKQYNFEVFELVRKLFQTSVFVFISKDSAGQVIFLLGICAIVVVVLGWMQPYVSRAHNGLAQWAQWNIFAIAFVVLLNRMELTTPDERFALDILLLLCLISVPIVALVIGFASFSIRLLEDGDNIADSKFKKLARISAQSSYRKHHHSGAHNHHHAVYELQQIISQLEVDSMVKEGMLRMVEKLDAKRQEESKVALLERKLLSSDKNETDMLRAKIAELEEENEQLVFTTNILNEQANYPEADADMFHTAEGGAAGAKKRSSLNAKRSNLAASNKRSILGIVKRNVTGLGAYSNIPPTIASLQE